MKKIIYILVIITVATTSFANLVSASTSNQTIQTNNNQDQDKYKIVYLYRKDLNWKPISNAPLGIIGYRDQNFVFVGIKLSNLDSYTLINYVDPWPGRVSCLGSNYPDAKGNIIISGKGSIKAYGKMWLVWSGDVDCQRGFMTKFNQSKYLFENNLI